MPRVGPYVFTTTGDTPVSGFSKAKARVDQRIASQIAVAGGQHLPPWVLHDLRRTMITVMNENLGIQPHVVEAVVNHVNGVAKAGVAGVYNRALYLDDRRLALEKWNSTYRDGDAGLTWSASGGLFKQERDDGQDIIHRNRRISGADLQAD